MKRKFILGLVLLLGVTACAIIPTTSKPFIFVNKSHIGMNENKILSQVLIRNMGEDGSVLHWSLTSGRNIVVNISSGEIKSAGKTEIKVRVSQTAINAKKAFVEEINISSNDVDKVIRVFYRPTGSNSGLKTCGSPSLSNNIEKDQKQANKAYVVDELLVKFKDNVGLNSQASINLAALDFGLLAVEDYNNNRPSLVKIPNSKDPLEYAKILEKDPRIEYAEPNYYLELLSTPNDSLYAEQWNLKDFGLEQAWDIETGTNNVVIAIIDSSVNTKHQDLAAKMLPGCDFNNKDNNPNPGPSNGGKSEHGTHVAGIAAAIGNNHLGVAGVAYGSGVKILPIKIFDDAGINGTIDNLIDAILWASGIDLANVGKNPNPAQILNMSVGASGNAIGNKLKSINDATKRAKAKGVIMFAASGNSGLSNEILYPAADSNIIAVGSVDQNRSRSSFSNYSKTGPSVDIMAPGGFSNNANCSNTKRIRSTFPNNQYGCLSGTSMASPFVAGVAALILSQNPSLNAQELKTKLFSSALKTNEMSKAEYGVGIVCADKALGAISQCGN